MEAKITKKTTTTTKTKKQVPSVKGMKFSKGIISPNFTNFGGKIMIFQNIQRHEANMKNTKSKIDNQLPWSYQNWNPNIPNLPAASNTTSAMNPPEQRERPKTALVQGLKALLPTTTASSVPSSTKSASGAASTKISSKKLMMKRSSSLQKVIDPDLDLDQDQKKIYSEFVELLCGFEDLETMQALAQCAVSEASERSLLSEYQHDSFFDKMLLGVKESGFEIENTNKNDDNNKKSGQNKKIPSSQLGKLKDIENDEEEEENEAGNNHTNENEEEKTDEQKLKEIDDELKKEDLKIEENEGFEEEEELKE